MENLQTKINRLLPRVFKPGRYLGNEWNAIRKPWDKTELHIALAFPEVYEIGMSHLGLQILYHLLNQQPWIAAERVFSPWIDMEQLMREEGVPLFSLESQKSIRHFDVFGITLQYELQYTNVLTLLDLAQIPIWASRRTESDPIVLGGGPCAYNPEPLAAFFDAFLIGDGEEAIIEIAETIREGKRRGRSRKGIIRDLSKIEGIYVPVFYEEHWDTQGRYLGTVPIQEGVPTVVRARRVVSLKPEFYSSKPIVPFIETAHDRYSLEIMRGCTRGCRFCNAGIIYRPMRVRPVDELIDLTWQVIRHTGFEEISVASLSTSDYPLLYELFSRLREILDAERVALAFPSLRADTFNRKMADFAQGFRRSGLTLAPEAGTQRLRDVINKNQKEADLLEAVRVAFETGWPRIKLYFMVGLPTETKEDLVGLVELIGRVVEVGRPFGKKEIHVSLSLFTPKPHTPFQWEAQDPISVYREKLAFLQSQIRWREVQLSWRDPESTRIEAVLGRGDRLLGQVIHEAWKRGARFDGWSERFSATFWQEAFQAVGCDPDRYTGAWDLQRPLPWNHIDKGISKAFLIRERERAYQGDSTPDCRERGCQQCGLAEQTDCRRPKRRSSGVKKDEFHTRPCRSLHPSPPLLTVRFAFQKRAPVRYISHLDTIRMFLRAFRRAGIRVAFSQGFHAHPRISMGPPLPLGYTGLAEYFDLAIEVPLPKDLKAQINASLPVGFEVIDSILLPQRVGSLTRSINLAHYRVVWPSPINVAPFSERLSTFLHANTWKVMRKEKMVDIRLSVRSAELHPRGMVVWVRMHEGGGARPEEILSAISPPHETIPGPISIERVGLFIERHGRRFTPIQIVELEGM